MGKRRKKVKLKKGRLAIIIAVLLFGLISFFYLFNLRIMQIEITGTNLLTDNEIMEIEGINLEDVLKARIEVLKTIQNYLVFHLLL